MKLLLRILYVCVISVDCGRERPKRDIYFAYCSDDDANSVIFLIVTDQQMSEKFETESTEKQEKIPNPKQSNNKSE